MSEFESIEHILQKLPAEDYAHVRRVLYGAASEHVELPIPEAATALGAEHDFEIKGYKLETPKESRRDPRIVRVGVIQNSVVCPTTDPVDAQYKAIEAKVEKIADAAALMGVNVLCLQEAWTAPFFFCTRERYPWSEFGEDAETGPAAQFISRIAKKYNMVIISSIFERDEKHNDTLHNTAVVFGNNGNYIGKHRKNHIPRVGDFNESTYYMEGDDGHPVFVTQFGRIAINICYGRHHPLNWMGFGLNGAELVFNPSATVGALSEPMWSLEARTAAIANNYYTFAINRVGTEVFPNEFTSGDGKAAHKDFGHFYGSSYCTAPDGRRTPGLSRVRDGLLVTEVDLNLCRQIKDKWCFPMTQRPEVYAKLLADYCKPGFKPQQVFDPSLESNAACGSSSDE
eukprot:TRINITY_DN916_c0_g1_i1.p1 TRINITY_DN916_c0_g1~~TRINITY_DN916_c0_g1_i1.p1  ORF type:complete len:399 (+),score=122.34 TRINITY_DN916_c0_g1_i1:46-1242(+)